MVTITETFYSWAPSSGDHLFYMWRKVARRPWEPRIVLEFGIKTPYVLDSWKSSCCPWIFSGVLKNHWI